VKRMIIESHLDAIKRRAWNDELRIAIEHKAAFSTIIVRAMSTASIDNRATGRYKSA
jgi:hypothetical protein